MNILHFTKHALYVLARRLCAPLLTTLALAQALALALALASAGSLAQDTTDSEQAFDWAPAFPIGARIPDLASLDQNAEKQDFDSLKGERGLLFLLSRSFDW